MNSSVQLVMAKYLFYRNIVDKLAASGEAGEVKKSCEEKLTRVDTLLKRRFWRQITLCWQLLHRVSEELILVMGEEELLAEGHKLLEDIKIASVPETIQNHWIEILHSKVTNLEKHLFDSTRCTQREIDATRHLFKTAAYTINECVDDRFWDISVRKFFAFIYGVLLLTIGIILLCTTCNDRFCLSFFNIILIGAIGGLVSGLITTDQEYLSKGHFWIPALYYSMVRPTVGAVAAVVVFWMIESHYLIQVDPPLRDCCVRFSCMSSNAGPQSGKKGDYTNKGKIRKQTGQNDLFPPGVAEAAGTKNEKGFSHVSSGKIITGKNKTREPKKQPAASSGRADKAKKGAVSNNNSSAQGDNNKSDTSLITLRTVEGKQIYLYLLLLFFAGFSGDKILKSVSCKLNARLFADAEKTKEAKK